MSWLFFHRHRLRRRPFFSHYKIYCFITRQRHLIDLWARKSCGESHRRRRSLGPKRKKERKKYDLLQFHLFCRNKKEKQRNRKYLLPDTAGHPTLSAWGGLNVYREPEHRTSADAFTAHSDPVKT